MRTRSTLTFALALALTTSLAEAKPGKPAAAHAKPAAMPEKKGPVAWCGDGTETLPNGLCHIDGGQPSDRRTLVVFLHGMIAKDVDWQWLQERALARQAKASKFEAVFARAPLGPGGYIWPGTVEAQQTSEQELIDGWAAARAYLEKRSGKAYDEVFLMGFSSGAYFTSSLVLRGRVKFDGYAVFAGGAGGAAPAEVADKAPVFVGVCADDKQTAAHSRAFGGALTARGWPAKIDELHVGHMFGDAHMAHALTYLRSAQKPKTKT